MMAMNSSVLYILFQKTHAFIYLYMHYIYAMLMCQIGIMEEDFLIFCFVFIYEFKM